MTFTFQYYKCFRWCKEQQMKLNSQDLSTKVSMTIYTKTIKLNTEILNIFFLHHFKILPKLK